MSSELSQISEELFEKIRSRFDSVTIGDDAAKSTQNPQKARFFNFDYVSSNGEKFGNVTISIVDQHSLKIYFSKNVSANLDEEQRKEWYDFLRDIRMFAKRNMLSFDTRDIARGNLKISDVQVVAKSDGTFGKDEVTESLMYGNAKSSYQKIGPAKLILRHTTRIDDSVRGARTRRIESIFVETHEGERFRLPFTNLSGARAMGRHVSGGGQVADDFGQHITKLVDNMQKMRKFISGTRNRTFEDSEATDMVVAAHVKYNQIRHALHSMAGNRGYAAHRDNWANEEPNDSEIDVTALKEKFVKRSFDDRLEEALPLVYSAYEEYKTQKTSQLEEFENWADTMTESTGTIPEAEDDIAKLQDLLDDVLPVGVDGSNATGALFDLLGDDELYDGLYQYSEEFGPEADARPMIVNWLKDNAPEVLGKLKVDGQPDESNQPDSTEPEVPQTESVAAESQLNEYYSVQSDTAPFFHHSTKFLDSAQRRLKALKEKGVDADIYEITFQNGQKVSKKLPGDPTIGQRTPSASTMTTESIDMSTLKQLAGVNHKR